MKSIFSTLDFTCGSLPTSRGRRFCGYSSSRLSRSSPVRTDRLLGDAFEYRLLRPLTPQLKDPVPFKRILRVPPIVAYYTAKPPSTPLYLMPTSSNYNITNKSNDVHQISKIQVTSKKSKGIVKRVLQSILNSVMLTVATKEFARNHFEPLTTKKSKEQVHCDIAIQTQALNMTKRYYTSENEDCSSSTDSREGYGAASQSSWAGEVRALRKSHLRLVLRQLRQLRDIDRLDRAMRRPTSTHP